MNKDNDVNIFKIKGSIKIKSIANVGKYFAFNIYDVKLKSKKYEPSEIKAIFLNIQDKSDTKSYKNKSNLIANRKSVYLERGEKMLDEIKLTLMNIQKEKDQLQIIEEDKNHVSFSKSIASGKEHPDSLFYQKSDSVEKADNFEEEDVMFV